MAHSIDTTPIDYQTKKDEIEEGRKLDPSESRTNKSGNQIFNEMFVDLDNWSIKSCMIPRVTVVLRETNPDAYTPNVVSVGPYHKKNPQLVPMEKYKLLYLRRFLQRKKGLDVKSCISQLEELKKEAIKCYEDAEDTTCDQFLQMLLNRNPSEDEEEPSFCNPLQILTWWKQEQKDTNDMKWAWRDHDKILPNATELSEAGVSFAKVGVFMDYLIDSNKDVSLLRQKGIIVNWMGDDKEVATLFNRIVKGVAVSVYDFYCKEVCKNASQHCNKPWNRMMANLRHNYFSSPWIGASTVAAILLLLLTTMQTILAFTGGIKK
ncbi:hypothetical protein HAX54_034208 [Datura stramonium]|uniref:Uncharacterized protein n=1 Tax=Datura stramonium TaxID=4076 RepID=A0ABS8VGE0_DATST|nr:hypothetical protein [Datura stramonium]